MNNEKLQARLNTKYTDLLLSWGNDAATLRKLLKLLYAYGYHFVGITDFDVNVSVDELHNTFNSAFFSYYHGNSKPLIHVFYNPITGKNEMQLTNLTTMRTYPQYKSVKAANYFG